MAAVIPRREDMVDIHLRAAIHLKDRRKATHPMHKEVLNPIHSPTDRGLHREVMLPSRDLSNHHHLLAATEPTMIRRASPRISRLTTKASVADSYVRCT